MREVVGERLDLQIQVVEVGVVPLDLQIRVVVEVGVVLLDLQIRVVVVGGEVLQIRVVEVVEVVLQMQVVEVVEVALQMQEQVVPEEPQEQEGLREEVVAVKGLKLKRLKAQGQHSRAVVMGEGSQMKSGLGELLPRHF